MSEPRLGNLITLLLPARSYKINCAWTTEKLMPGIEQFACRLLLIFDQLYPSELQNYFGLNEREREVLLDSLLANRLITINPEGHVEASSFLRKHAASNGGKPSLVKYQERTEEVAFDLLTLSVCKPQPHRRLTSGLPELLPRNKIGVDIAAVTEAFSTQFRHHLMLSRNNEYERQRTQLYKVMGCSSHEMVQIPVEVEVSYNAVANSEPQKFTRSYEHIGNNRLPLANELEAHIADFLGEQQLEESGLDCAGYCEAVRDPVLKQFSNGYQFDYSGWLEARESRQTGYGNQQTSGMLGAVYLPDNAKRFIGELRDALRSHEGMLTPKAMWYSSEVPLWGANSNQLARFNRDLGGTLDNHTDDQSARVTLLHLSDSNGESRLQRKHHLGRFANGIGLTSNAEFDRLELLLIPGVIGLVQYHGQPNADSALTLPVGYTTTDPERLQLLEFLLATRVEGAIATINWSESKCETLGSLLSDDLLAKLDKKSGDDVGHAIRRKQKVASSNAVRAILSLRNKS
ncbi:hypothetical protein [Photobacterium profundum]|uniref:Uncharacterized protein n=1 Tax=Photobacterium profundum (strain SS9) TaxID=298386 RepID=Q6LRS1_PHOPR|nr:hypothetical protein [Photobacterium profundum]CAG20005.1 hypothetical protein PBPRA1594 [Photobacterium profundum SS9]